MSGRLILASNRLPVVLEQTPEGWSVEPASGGLATGLSRPHRETGGRWIGWAGIRCEDGRVPEAVEELLDERGFTGLPLSPEEHRAYYTHTSNRCLWPLLHGFLEKVHFDAGDWQVYRKVNERFAAAILEEAEDDDLVFVQDFHLMLVPRLLREARPTLRIGFFLHVPFPPSWIFRVFPERGAVLEGLLGADVVAFHTLEYLRHFRGAARRVLGVEVEASRLEVDGREVHLLAQPLGLDIEVWQPEREGSALLEAQREVAEAVGERRLILGVERLDYTKGIPERLRAFRDLLEESPSLVDELVFVQVAVPSRTEAEEYRDLKDEVDRLVGEINGRFGRPGVQPLHYQFRSVDRDMLTALYRRADVAVVTPLRDGLNLVAKEYVASRTEDSGVLILGEFTGAGWELGEALQVNPYDPGALKDAMTEALAMPPEEQARRMAPMRERVREADVHTWTEACVGAIRRAAARESAPRALEGEARAALLGAWDRAASRQVVLDYDGTLVGFADHPGDARPDGALLDLLGTLAGREGVETWIVSGRSRDVLGKWLGETGVGLIAEHGAVARGPGEEDFRPLRHTPPDLELLQAARRVMDQVTARVPGSLVEEKPLGLAWHYRAAGREAAVWQARELVMHLEELVANSGLEVLRGDKVVELRPAGLSKGAALTEKVLADGPAGFLLVAGDDVTDESLFHMAPGESYTILVGDRRSRARWRVPSSGELRALLAELASR